MDIRTIRRANFDRLVTEATSIAELARKTGASEKYLSQIKTGFQGKRDKTPRQVGDSLARKLEAGMGKPNGWMDSIHSRDGKVEQTYPTYAAAEPAGKVFPAHIQQIVEAIQHRPASDPVIKAISLIIAGADSDSVQEAPPAGGYIAKAIQAGDSFEAKRRKRRTGTS